MKISKSQAENKSAPIQVRFTPAQVDALKAAATARSVTVSEHIRDIVLNDYLTSTAIMQGKLQKEATGHDTNT